MSAVVTCPGCRASVPEVADMRAHPYIGSAPGCWLLYSELLAASTATCDTRRRIS